MSSLRGLLIKAQSKERYSQNEWSRYQDALTSLIEPHCTVINSPISIITITNEKKITNYKLYVKLMEMTFFIFCVSFVF